MTRGRSQRKKTVQSGALGPRSGRAESGLKAFRYDGLGPVAQEARWRRIEEEALARLAEGDSEDEVQDWIEDQRARFQRVEHECYSDEMLFNERRAVEAFGRGLRKWHRVAGEAVSGEAFERLMAQTWQEIGYDVHLSAKNEPGADVQVSYQNSWLAWSMKSEARANPSRRRIDITSLAPHHVEINSPGDCWRALEYALQHLARYDRMVYLKSVMDEFPSGEGEAVRYSLLDVPLDDIYRRLREIDASAFRGYFEDAEKARERNAFRHVVFDKGGRKLFSVTVFRQPPRVKIGGIDMEYCRPIANYWTEVPQGLARRRG